MRHKWLLPISLLVLFVLVNGAWAKKTMVVVHVVSKDAKFVGTSMGGALVTVKNADTGEVLAKGRTTGTTGDTEMLMKTNMTRRDPLVDEKAARFIAMVNIDEPTRAEITAMGPAAQRQSANIVSITQWLIPGKDIVKGNAILLELPGLVVDVLSPPAHLKLGEDDRQVDIAVNVTMMCGCPLEPGGLWDSDGFEIKAVIKRNGKRIDELELEYAGQPSQFAGTYAPRKKGSYEITVYAFDPSNGNTGVDFSTFVIK